MKTVKAGMTFDTIVMGSMCDESSLMSIPALLDAFQDIAGVHAATAETGVLQLEDKGLFWVVSKMRMVIKRRPLVGEETQLTTWILPPDRISCERDCSLHKGDEVLAYCRCIWAALRRDNGRPEPTANFYPYPDEEIAPPDDRPFKRMSRNFEGAEEIGRYTIRSVDIDRGGHMNNVNYVRAMLGCFTCEEIEKLDITELDMQFQLQCYEGETITFVKRESDTAKMEIGAINSEGKATFMAAIY